MKVSIIVAVYNIEKYLEKCLQSLILTNSYVFEIICVNDGSRDLSVDIIKKYRKKDERIHLINKENRGISSARNVGINNAKGDFLIFIDGDDYVDADAINKALEELNAVLKKEKIDAVWCGYFRDDWNGERLIEPIFSKKVYNKEEIRNLILPSILGVSLQKLYLWFDGKDLQKNQEFPTVWRFIYSKDLIDLYKIRFNENVKTGEDILFNWEFLFWSTNIIITNYKYYHYIWRKGSLTQNTSKHFYQSKQLFIVEREKLNEKLREREGKNYGREYQGSLVLTKIQMAVSLSKCSLIHFQENYIKFVKYAMMKPIVEAYAKLELEKAPLKYKIPLYIAKKQWNSILFFLCFLINKLKIQIYPEE